MSRSPIPIRRFGILMYTVAFLSTPACHTRTRVAAPPFAKDSVNAGYGAQTQMPVGRTAQSVTAEELAKVKVKRVEEMLSGRIPGVRVLPTRSGGFSIRIRGAHNAPLYIVDGMPVEVVDGEGLNWLDPADIARIDVLKDAVETTMYGMRGANGVVLIITKRKG